MPPIPARSKMDITLVRNAALCLTMDPGLGQGPLGILEGIDILIQADRIAGLERGLVLQGSGVTVVDATGKIVLPGFVDVHNHLWQTIIRGCGTDQDLLGWLESCVRPLGWPLRTAMDEHDTYFAVRLATLDLIRTGVTTTVDWAHGSSLTVTRSYIRALAESGLRFIHAYGQTVDAAKDIERVKRDLIDPNPLATLQVTSHPGMDNLEHLTVMTRTARALGVRLNVHVHENLRQRELGQWEALETAGAFALGPNLLVNHAIHLTDDEIATLAQHDVRVTHNPLSNMRLASGIIRLPELRAAGVKVGLGLDGGTNDTSDVFANMRAAVGLQRVRALRADVYPTVTDVLRMATLGGAEVLGMADRVGSLTPGKKADLVILNPNAVNFAPRRDWVSQIVFNAQPENVEYVLVAGRLLKAVGKLQGVSAARVLAGAETAAVHVQEALAKGRATR